MKVFIMLLMLAVVLSGCGNGAQGKAEGKQSEETAVQESSLNETAASVPEGMTDNKETEEEHTEKDLEELLSEEELSILRGCLSLEGKTPETIAIYYFEHRNVLNAIYDKLGMMPTLIKVQTESHDGYGIRIQDHDGVWFGRFHDGFPGQDSLLIWISGTEEWVRYAYGDWEGSIIKKSEAQFGLYNFKRWVTISGNVINNCFDGEAKMTRPAKDRVFNYIFKLSNGEVQRDNWTYNNEKERFELESVENMNNGRSRSLLGSEKPENYNKWFCIDYEGLEGEVGKATQFYELKEYKNVSAESEHAEPWKQKTDYLNHALMREYKSLLFFDNSLKSVDGDISQFAILDVNSDGIYELAVHVSKESSAKSSTILVYYDPEKNKIETYEDSYYVQFLKMDNGQFISAGYHMSFWFDVLELNENGVTKVDEMGFDPHWFGENNMNPEEQKKKEQALQELHRYDVFQMYYADLQPATPENIRHYLEVDVHEMIEETSGIADPFEEE